MNALFLLTDAENGGQIEEIARTFGVDWSHLIAQMITFSIVCFLLYRFAYRPILKKLGERRQLIAQGLADAERIKAELAQTEARRQEVMAQAGAQATQFIEDPRGAPPRLQEQATRQAIAA